MNGGWRGGVLWELRWVVGAALEAQLLNSVAESVGMQAQDFGCAARPFNYASGSIQYRDDVGALDFLECGGRCRGFAGRRKRLRRFIAGGGAGGRRESVNEFGIQFEYGSPREDYGALDHVLKLADISGPGIA